MCSTGKVNEENGGYANAKKYIFLETLVMPPLLTKNQILGSKYTNVLSLFSPWGSGEKSASIVVIAYRDEQQTSASATLTKVATLPAAICGGFGSNDPHGCPAVLFAVFAATITPILETARAPPWGGGAC